ncbi:MAG: hypothetical protein F4X84_03075 [Synechococcus sp. SB0662_bin_45]|nr:hypothetical protein [Synechococcus sp. SB0668_bin_13]MYE21362.1 hypothetical protein [Synechococcus sp. SB0662_bin_45]
MSRPTSRKQAVLDYAKRIGRLEAMPLLALVSLLLSTLFFSGVFGFRLLNLAYIANIANFTMLVSGCLKLRKENVLPLVAAGLSVALSLPPLWGMASFLQQGSEFMHHLQT